VLGISYSGYVAQEITVGKQRDIVVLLEEDNSVLNEVVVVGYGSQKRSSISGAVSSITSDEIAELPILRAEQALQGRVAGVTVAQNSGSPGSALTVRVRGTGTINNSDPLYIVDGVPVDGLDFLNPNDIESINVLKDAASSAIYGARGANGVVLITTKSGKKIRKAASVTTLTTGYKARGKPPTCSPLASMGSSPTRHTLLPGLRRCRSLPTPTHWAKAPTGWTRFSPMPP